MITRQQIETLLQYRPSAHLVTSCYLNLDRAEATPAALKIRIKDLLQSAQRQLASKAATHEQREALRRDFERIEEYVMERITTNNQKGLAVFCSTPQNWWQTFTLPHIPRNILIADREPYVRPLKAILSGYHRCAVALVDRTHGRLFELYMDKIVEHGETSDVVPRRVNDGGFQGREERSIERRHEQAVRHHMQNLAVNAFQLFQRDHFDRLILGGQRDLLNEFRELLHPYLKERLCGEFHGDVSKLSTAEVLQRATAIERQYEATQENKLVSDLVRRAEAGNRAVKGVEATLEALTRGEAQVLLVEEGFEMPGHTCAPCHFVSLVPQECPQCQQRTQPCPDVVDAAIELAMKKNCELKHVRGMTPLHDAGRIGAILRYQA